MVFIKLEKEQWITLGLTNFLSSEQYTTIGTRYYLPYSKFKSIAHSTNQPLHSSLCRQNIITNQQFQLIKRQSERTPEEKKMMQQIKAKHELRMMNKANRTNKEFYFEKGNQEGIKDMEKSLSFGMMFLFSFFMAGMTGYYFGTYFLGLDFTKSMMIAMLFIFLTIVIETSLYMIKQTRKNKKKHGQSFPPPKQSTQKPNPMREANKKQKQD